MYRREWEVVEGVETGELGGSPPTIGNVDCAKRLSGPQSIL